jgi:hypothetical protein
VTVKDIVDYAKESNELYFGGELDLRSIRFSISNRMTRAMGKFSYSHRQGQQIKVSSLLSGITDEWKNTVVHELVHAWQYQSGLKLDHGYSFKKKAAEIARISNRQMIITRCGDNEEVREVARDRRSEKMITGGVRQYMFIKKNGRVLFLRNADSFAIKREKAYGAQVFVNDSEIWAPVSHAKNYLYLQMARRYYPKSVVAKTEELGVVWKEL